MKRLPLIACLLCALALGSLMSCGADGVSAPPSAAPSTTCRNLDDLTAGLRSELRDGNLDGLAEVVDRLANERNGTRVSQALRVVLQLLQSLPREEATTFEFEIILTILDQVGEPLGAILDFLAQGQGESELLFPLLSTAIRECPADSFILTVEDIFKETALMAALGETLGDPQIVALVRALPGQSEEGKIGFIALFRTILNAIQSPSFDFAELRSILSFADIDEPPLSGLLDELERFLASESFDHLLLTVECIQVTEVDGHDGTEVLGGFLYDLITLPELDISSILSIAAPLLEEIQDEDIQTLGAAALERIKLDRELRAATIDLVTFFLREDNIGPLLDSVVVLFQADVLPDLVALIGELTVRCPESPPDYAVSGTASQQTQDDN
ncbi:MAG: hypothetical protein KC561_08235 [Myxococcales bacterium]|nr:hypothetical protein [Myxococcales bacterium]